HICGQPRSPPCQARRAHGARTVGPGLDHPAASRLGQRVGRTRGRGRAATRLAGHPDAPRDARRCRSALADGRVAGPTFRWSARPSSPEGGIGRMNLKRVHVVAALLATLTIALFFVSTVFVEAFGSRPGVAWVKSLIVVPGLFVVVPAIAVTGPLGS